MAVGVDSRPRSRMPEALQGYNQTVAKAMTEQGLRPKSQTQMSGREPMVTEKRGPRS